MSRKIEDQQREIGLVEAMDNDMNDVYEHTVEFEKGTKTTITINEYSDYTKEDTVFGITKIYLHNLANDDPGITVFGSFREPYLHLGKDSTSGLERPLYFVVGDVLVAAECVSKYEYQGLLLPNLPGEVEFFVSLNGMTPISQIVTLNFPKTKKSQTENELEEKVAKLLVTNEKDCRKLMKALKRCDNKKTHSERVLKEYLKDWVFDNCKTVNAIDRKGHQVIHLFASLGYAWAITILKRFGFSFNAKDENGWTPLHWAAFYGRKGAAMALLVGRANPTLVTTPTSDYPNEHTAAAIAFERGHYHLAAYLMEFVKHPEKIVTISTHPAKRSTHI